MGLRLIRIRILFGWLKNSYLIMDPKLHQEIELYIQPLLQRIDSLERQNEELGARVKHLEFMVCPDRNYQKLTGMTIFMQFRHQIT